MLDSCSRRSRSTCRSSGGYPTYERRWLRFDLVAGVAVWAVLTPQAIAYASLAGAPPQAGFYAATAAVLAYALLGTCKELSVGPEHDAGDHRRIDRRRGLGRVRTRRRCCWRRSRSPRAAS